MSETATSDLLSSVLSRLRPRARVFATPTLCGAWCLNTSGIARAQFHLIAAGGCYLHLKSAQTAQRLEVGDLIVLPHDAWHMLSASATRDRDDTFIDSSTLGPGTSLVCGQFEFPDVTSNAIRDALPPLMLIRADASAGHLATLLNMLAEESLSVGSGKQAVLDALSDALFVLVLRHHIAATIDPRGLLAALADPQLARALQAIHARPGDAWTVERMAQAAGMSRTRFAERFSSVMAETPMNYLAAWRMIEAERLFRDSRLSVARVAGILGYETEAAFRRAFRRITGRSPGAVRRAARPSLVA
jgi:AraC family transcriptional regulator, activator of mtrCDE